MSAYMFGPLRVEVDMTLGHLPPPWGGEYKPTYNLEVKDQHGHIFQAGWYDEVGQGPERIARRMVILLEQALEEKDFVQDFSQSYTRGERDWRTREGYRIRSEAKEFIPEEITKAAAIAIRKLNYEEFKGPRDWSPKGEMPD